MSKVCRSVRCLLSAAALAASLLTPSAGAAATITTIEPGMLQVCLYAGFAPFASKEGGVWQGWDVKFLQDFAAANGLKLKVVEKPEFQDIWLWPGEKKCDLAGTGISDTKERRVATGTASKWSKTYYGVVRSFIVRTADYVNLKDVKALRGKKVIVTKDSTADQDLRNRLQIALIPVCAGQTRQPSCVQIGYPRENNEENAAKDVLAGGPDAPFAYGGGYGSVQLLACKLGGLAVVWPHCNMVKNGTAYAEDPEPFSFVVRVVESTSLLTALDDYIQKNDKLYEGTAIPQLDCPPKPGR
jgi:Bacterial extracellular solute-binding proteins, family 3